MLHLPRWVAKAVERALRQPAGEDLVPIECRCQPPRRHGPHWVDPRRLAKGGDLHGQVKQLRVDPVVAEDLQT